MGIVIQFFFNDEIIWLTTITVAFCCSIALYYLNIFKFYPITFLLFFQLGYFSMYLNNNDYVDNIPPEEAYYQIKILETTDTRKNWNKGLAEIQYVYNTQKEAKEVSQKLLFYTDSNSIKLISKGDIILLSSKISRITNKGNPGEFNAMLYWKSKKTSLLSFFDFSDFSILRNEPITNKKTIERNLVDILENNLPKSQIGLAKALFLGDKSSLATETTNSFSAAGAMHLLAISGLHIGLMILVLMYVFRLFSRLINRYQATCIIILFIWFYAYLIGFPPSVVRSVFMFSLISLGAISSAQNNQMNLLCFSAAILLLLNPWHLFDIGFQLSYLAMFGILLTYRSIQQFFIIKNKIIRFLWNGTALGLSAQIFTIPLCLYYFHQFPNYFAITNLGIILMSGILISFGAGLFLFSWSPLLSIGIGFALSSLLYLLVFFISWIEKLPGAVSKGFHLSEFELLMFYFIIIAVLFMAVYKTRSFYKYSLVTLILIAISYHRYKQLNNNHLILFNSNTLCFAIHTNNQIHFFYDDLKENEFKYHRILESYEKCYPGIISTISIKNKNIKYSINKQKLALQSENNKKLLFFNNKEYHLEYDNKSLHNPNINQIGMPWIQGLSTTLNKSIIYPF